MKARPIDFLIVGAAKCGTTSLYSYLSQHPDIFLPDNKEPWFFTYWRCDISKLNLGPQKNNIVTELEEYEALFEAASRSQLIGEASTVYLYKYNETIENIAKNYPNWRQIKIIIILRDPIERAFSHYLNDFRSGVATTSFGSVIRHCKNRTVFELQNYLEYGMYSKQVQAFTENFSHVRVYFFEEMIRDVDATVQDIFEFLGVRRIQTNNYVAENRSGIPKLRPLVDLIIQPNAIKTLAKAVIPKPVRTWVARKMLGNLLVKPSISNEDRENLHEYFSLSVSQLQTVVSRDLGEIWPTFRGERNGIT